jgi:tetratricopeptide (TPR) repeat protein
MTSSARITRLATAIAVVLAAIAAAPARAEDKAEARRRFAAGVERADAGAYEQAIAEFRRAYEASPNYAVLYNIAEMQRALGDPAGALETFQRYLADGGDAIPAARRAKVAAAMEGERAKTGALIIEVTPPAPAAAAAPVLVLVDDRTVGDGAATAQAPLRVNAGVHRIVATAGNATAERELSVAAGETATVALALVASPTVTETARLAPSLAARPPPAAASQPAPAPAPGPAPASMRRTVGTAAMGVGAAGLAIAAVSYAVARARWHSAVADGCTLARCTDNARSEYDGAQRALDVFNVSAIAGGVLVTGGALLLLSGRW